MRSDHSNLHCYLFFVWQFILNATERGVPKAQKILISTSFTGLLPRIVRSADYCWGPEIFSWPTYLDVPQRALELQL